MSCGFSVFLRLEAPEGTRWLPVTDWSVDLTHIRHVHWNHFDYWNGFREYSRTIWNTNNKTNSNWLYSLDKNVEVHCKRTEIVYRFEWFLGSSLIGSRQKLLAESDRFWRMTKKSGSICWALHTYTCLALIKTFFYTGFLLCVLPPNIPLLPSWPWLGLDQYCLQHSFGS